MAATGAAKQRMKTVELHLDTTGTVAGELGLSCRMVWALARTPQCQGGGLLLSLYLRAHRNTGGPLHNHSRLSVPKVDFPFQR